MAAKYYKDNELDTTTKEQFSGQILNKVVKQLIETKTFSPMFNVFKRSEIDGAGYQIEEIEVGNLKSEDFDPAGQKALDKVQMNFKTLYHKINRDRTFSATVSDKQIRTAMLSKEGVARVGNAIVNELYNSSAIEDYDAMKDLLKDIAGETKKMVVVDLAGGSADMDDLTKAIQTVAGKMTKPTTTFNFAGFKREFNSKDDLVLIIDSALKSRFDVESLANAFNPEKKGTVGTIIELDAMPNFTITDVADASKGEEITIGAGKTITTYKCDAQGSETLTDKKPIAFLLNRRAIIDDEIERHLEDQRNAKGRFTNYFLNAVDLLSYSTLRNAVVFVD